jgi:hypothetical protein
MSVTRYRLVVQGELGPRYASAFEGMTLCAHDGETDITGPIIDQSHLMGLLERIASLGLALTSLTPIERRTSRSTSSRIHNQPVFLTTTLAIRMDREVMTLLTGTPGTSG